MSSKTGRLLKSRAPDRGSWVHFCAVILAGVAILCAPALHAASLDTLIVIDADGQPGQLQHTISSDGELVVVEIPADARFPYAHFMGPERQTFAHAWAANPTRLAIWSGSAILHHSLADDPKTEDADTARTVLSLPGYLPTLDIEDGELSQWRLTLIFASTVRPVDWAPIDASGTWTLSGANTLIWHQNHGRRVALSVSMEQVVNAPPAVDDPCEVDETTLDTCAADTDADNVPDYRDLCLGPPSEVAAAQSDVTGEALKLDEFGCTPTRPLRLDDVAFQAGMSYLDIGSRRLLDRLAAALMHFETREYQIGAHTDSEGTDNYNRSLSKMRAESVRRYLMLRGIAPDRLQAAGYGEDYPRRRNDSVAGRRANRRVELKRLD